jgi:putative oxidoreductase
MARLIRLLLRSLLTFVFLAAAANKIADPGSLMAAIQNYHIVPWSASEPLAHILPWCELFGAIALWIPRYRSAAPLLLSLLLSAFLVALLSAKIRNLDISCGCFGSVNAANSVIKQIRLDLILLGAALFLLQSEQSPTPPHAPDESRL